MLFRTKNVQVFGINLSERDHFEYLLCYLQTSCIQYVPYINGIAKNSTQHSSRITERASSRLYVADMAMYVC